MATSSTTRFPDPVDSFRIKQDEAFAVDAT